MVVGAVDGRLARVDGILARAAAEAEATARRDLLEAQAAFTSSLVTLTPVLTELTNTLKPFIKAYTATIGAGQASGGFGVGEAAFRAFGETRNVSGTMEDPAVRQALERAAAASERTAANTEDLRNAGTLR